MEGQEIPLPHGIKEIIRVWDPTALLATVVALALLSLLTWLAYGYWQRRRGRGRKPTETVIDWRAQMSKLIDAGAGQWTPVACQYFYKSLRQYCLGCTIAPVGIKGAFSRSEQAVFGGFFWEFEVASEDLRLVLGAIGALQGDGIREQPYPSEVAEKRRHPSEDLRTTEPRIRT